MEWLKLEGPTFLLRQGHPSANCRGLMNMFKNGDSITSLSKWFQFLVTLTVKVFRVVPVFQFLPVACCPVTGHHWKEPVSVLFAPCGWLFICINKIPFQPSLRQLCLEKVSSLAVFTKRQNIS